MTEERVNSRGTRASHGTHGPPLRSWYDLVNPRRVGWLRLLLLAVPATILLRFAGARPIWLFVASGLAIIPLAGLMGEATEQLAERLGPGIGGLLNATFGNAAELIIALFALFKGYDEVVKASLAGSILGNVLLVLGASLLAGGLKHRTQTFNRTAAGVGSTMLVLASFGLLVPAIFHELPEVTAQDRPDLPRARAEHRRLGDPDAHLPGPPGLQPGHPQEPVQSRQRRTSTTRRSTGAAARRRPS